MGWCGGSDAGVEFPGYRLHRRSFTLELSRYVQVSHLSVQWTSPAGLPPPSPTSSHKQSGVWNLECYSKSLEPLVRRREYDKMIRDQRAVLIVVWNL